MTVTPTSIRALFPELGTQPDSRIQQFIDMASRRIDTAVFGSLFDDAVSFLSAHMLTKALAAQAGGGKGLVSSETVGDLSRSYVQHGGVLASGYSSTPYGVEFLKIRRQVAQSPAVM